jgi:RNA polymerase sigma-70 factor (ECF subfamily)
MDSDIHYSPGTRFSRSLPSSRFDALKGNAADAMLIARIAAHDRAALRILYTRHHARIRRFVLHFTDEAAADALVHGVFLDVWRTAGRFAGHSPVSTWLLALARHELTQAARVSKASAAGPDAAPPAA